MVSSSAAPVHRTRPRSGPRCVSTTAWTSLAATKPGPRPTTSGASSIRVPRLRLAILASTTTAGRSRASDEPSGSTTTGTNLRSSRTDGTWSRTTRRPGTPSTSAGPARTASAKATLRRTARGCSLSRTATRNPHRKSRRAAAEAISPPPRTTTSSGRGTRALIARTLPADLETARQLHLHGAYGGGIHPAADRDHLRQEAHPELFPALRAHLHAPGPAPGGRRGGGGGGRPGGGRGKALAGGRPSHAARRPPGRVGGGRTPPRRGASRCRGGPATSSPLPHSRRRSCPRCGRPRRRP